MTGVQTCALPIYPDRRPQGAAVRQLRPGAQLGREETVGKIGGLPRNGADRGRCLRRYDSGTRHPGRAADAAIPGAHLQRHQRGPVSRRLRVGNLRLEGYEENTRPLRKLVIRMEYSRG